MKFIRKASNAGKQVISNIGEELKQLGVLLYRLESGRREQIFIGDGRETLLVLLDGTINFHTDGLKTRMSRNGVFEAMPEAIFLPVGRSWEITIDANTSSRFVVCEAALPYITRLTTSLRPYQIRKQDIEYFERGTGQFQRSIRNITTEKIQTS